MREDPQRGVVVSKLSMHKVSYHGDHNDVIKCCVYTCSVTDDEFGHYSEIHSSEGRFLHKH